MVKKRMHCKNISTKFQPIQKVTPSVGMKLESWGVDLIFHLDATAAAVAVVPEEDKEEEEDNDAKSGEEEEGEDVTEASFFSVVIVATSSSFSFEFLVGADSSWAGVFVSTAMMIIRN